MAEKRGTTTNRVQLNDHPLGLKLDVTAPEGGELEQANCPCCGGPAYAHGSGLLGAFVACYWCGLRTPSYTSREQARIAWNRRAFYWRTNNRHTSDNAHVCCEHNPAKACCDNMRRPAVDVEQIAEEITEALLGDDVRDFANESPTVIARILRRHLSPNGENG